MPFDIEAQRDPIPQRRLARAVVNAAGELQRSGSLGPLFSLGAAAATDAYQKRGQKSVPKGSDYKGDMKNKDIVKKRRAASSAKSSVINTASSQFNPGGAGGYVQKFKKRTKRKRVKSVLSKKQKSAVRAIAKTADRIHMTKFMDQENTYYFPLQTSATYPLIPFAGFFGATPSALATTSPPRGVVGWNLLEDASNARLKVLYANNAVQQAPFTTSGTNEARIFDFSNVPGLAEQYSFKHELKFEFLLKNLSNTGAQCDFYLLKCDAETSTSCSTDLAATHNNSSINAASLVTASDPPALTSLFDQYWSVRGQGKRFWSIKQRQRVVLNPGDEATIHMSHSATMKYEGVAGGTYLKGCWAILCRIQGDLSVDTVDCSQVNMAAANVACRMHRTHKISVSRKEYDGILRIAAPVTGTIVQGKVAGDATNFTEDF